jgi:hypothetical protein
MPQVLVYFVSDSNLFLKAISPMKVKFMIMITSAWLFMTMTVDFLVLPKAFRLIGDIWLAGSLGIEIFRNFNPLEVVFAGTLVVLTYRESKRITPKLILPMVLLLIALSYQFYFTPNITATTRVIMALKGQQGPLLSKAFLDHHFFHSNYVRLDGVKLLCLLVFLGIIMIPSHWTLRKKG